jgi:predicted solute-binding protein
MIATPKEPPTIAEEADLLRRGVIQYALTPEVRAREEARALRRDQERAVAQAERLLAVRKP